MSAILGVVHRDGRPVEAHTMAAMRCAMSSWGPDGDTIVRDGAPGFGQLRLLSTPEAHAERGPWLDRPAGVLITASGRIDNRGDLLPHLGRDERAADIADGTLLGRAYLRWGERCVERIYGDWSFAAWHVEERRLFLARDHFGDTPLYYYADPLVIAFASDVNALLALGLPDLRIDELYLAHAIGGWPSEDGARTIIEPILQLSPGHTLTATSTHLRLRQYWRFDDIQEVRLPTRSDYIDTFRALFDEAVRARVRAPTTHDGAPVNIAVAMSGGLDSTSVAATAAALHTADSRIVALTSVPVADTSPFADRGDEHAYAEQTARHAGIDLHPIRGVRFTPMAAVRKTLDFLPDPAVAGANLYWILDLTRTAQDLGCRVLLTGTMGNPGMSWFGDMASQPLGVRLRHQGLLGVVRHSAARWRSSLGRSHLGRIARARRFARVPVKERCRELPINEELARRLDFFWRTWVARNQDAARGGRHRILRRAQVGRGNVAALAAWSGLEARDPTADVRVLMFTLAIPDEVFVDPISGTDRWLIRTAMQGRLPDEVRLERRLFSQAGDLISRLRASSAEVDEVLEEIRGSEASEFVDVDRMTEAWRVAKNDDSRGASLLAHRVLMQGATAGLCITRLRETMSDANVHRPFNELGNFMRTPAPGPTDPTQQPRGPLPEDSAAEPEATTRPVWQAPRLTRIELRRTWNVSGPGEDFLGGNRQLAP